MSIQFFFLSLSKPFFRGSPQKAPGVSLSYVTPEAQGESVLCWNSLSHEQKMTSMQTHFNLTGSPQ